MRKAVLAALLFFSSAGAQTFVHMTDPQFGMYSKNADFAYESARFESAIASANRLKPAFVIVTGDLINDPANPAQAAEYKRIASRLDPSIRLFSVPGNHDVGNQPTPATLARYRERNGPDYYAFRVGGIAGIVLNSNLEKGTGNVPGEAAKMEAWFKAELERTQAGGAKQILVFQHIPFFLRDPAEPEEYENVPPDVRLRYLKLMHDHGVNWVFAGHLHRNLEAANGNLRIVGTAPVGMPVNSKSGFRVVTVTPAGLTHRFLELEPSPQAARRGPSGRF